MLLVDEDGFVAFDRDGGEEFPGAKSPSKKKENKLGRVVRSLR